MNFNMSKTSVQYVNQAVRQQGSRQEELSDLIYWKQQLADAALALDLPTDRPRSSDRSAVRTRYSFQVPRPLPDRLKSLSQQEGTSIFMTLCAAFQILLYRYTGQEDLLVGTPRMERSPAGYAMVNFLVLRTRVAGKFTFLELLRHVRGVVLEAYAHQNAPFEQIMGELQKEQNPAHHSLCQVMFVLEESPQEALDDLALVASPVKMEAGNTMAGLDLALFIQDTAQELRGEVEYDANLFDATTIARMVGHWNKLLESIVSDPNQSVDDLPLLSDTEWCQQVVEWNATRVDYPRDRCYHELFEAQVAHTPEAVAVVCEQERLTYRELNRRANRLARHLQDLGVGPETLVALLIERGIDFVVAILAIFKAGGAFLPLDPQHPAMRHARILEQSRSRLVLTTEKFGTALIEASGTIDVNQRPQVIYLEKLLQKSGAAENLPLLSTPGNLAYVMFTSGSTGVPKGVMVEQVGMVNHIYAKIADLGINAEDRVAQNGPPCFDIVVWQCLAAFLSGGCTFIFKDEIALNPVQLLRQIEQQNITILQAVPSILRAVVQQAETLGDARPRLKNLRWVVPTGDALPPELCRQWLQLYPTIPLLNTYGSTECSDDQCHYAIYQPPPLDYPLAIMPIGRPIQNMQTYILDQQLLPVPIGVVGDLYIGGIGVGRGYLHDERKTAEVFILDPFSQEPHARLYKTRDRARYLPDGLIEFLGRSDNLVKVQGVRIEPGEIEALLEQHPAIQETIVIAREIAGGNKRLVAYIVPTRDQVPASEELRTWLKEKLPEYMIPSAFVLLDAMPLNSNGKVDRRALPEPEWIRRELDETGAVPMTPIQAQLRQIWEELLNVRPIGVRDNFFELGGHSLLAVQLITRIEQVWGKKVSATGLLAGPTIEQLASEIEQPEAATSSTSQHTDHARGSGLASSVKSVWSTVRRRTKAATPHKKG